MRRIFSFDHPHAATERSAGRGAPRPQGMWQPQPRPIDAFVRMSACRLLPYMTPLSHHVGECIARDRESPAKIPHLLRTHTLLRYNHTYTVPFSAHKVHAPRGRSPSRRHRAILSLSLSLSLGPGCRRASSDDRARARIVSVVVDATDARTRAGGRDATRFHRVRLTTRAPGLRIVRARRRRRRRRRANAKAVEEDGRHRWRLAVAQSTR